MRSQGAPLQPAPHRVSNCHANRALERENVPVQHLGRTPGMVVDPMSAQTVLVMGKLSYRQDAQADIGKVCVDGSYRGGPPSHVEMQRTQPQYGAESNGIGVAEARVSKMRGMQDSHPIGERHLMR